MKQSRPATRAAHAGSLISRLRHQLSQRNWRSLQRRQWGWIIKPGPLVMHAPMLLEPRVAADPTRPPLYPCRHCGSLGCGPFRCRFDTGPDERRQQPPAPRETDAPLPPADNAPGKRTR